MFTTPKSKFELDADIRLKRHNFKKVAGDLLGKGAFDARHMDDFLGTVHGDKVRISHPPTIYPLASLSGSQSAANLRAPYSNLISPSQTNLPKNSIQSNIRPTSNFLGLPRDCRKETNFLLSSKPQPLMDRKEVRLTDKQLNTMRNPLRREHELWEKAKQNYDHSKINYLLQTEDNLTYPKDRIKQLNDVKEQSRKYLEFRNKQMLLGKRERLIQNGWRNGILGIDSTTHKDSMYYKNAQKAMVEREFNATQINSARFNAVCKYRNSSSDVEFSNLTMKEPDEFEDAKIKVVPNWKSKRISEQRFADTHAQIFQSKLDNPIASARAMKLRNEELKGKNYNILSGVSETSHKNLPIAKDIDMFFA